MSLSKGIEEGIEGLGEGLFPQRNMEEVAPH